MANDTDTQSKCAENNRLQNTQPQMRHLYHTFSSQCPGIPVEEGAERVQEPEVVGDYKEVGFPRHSKALAHINTELL